MKRRYKALLVIGVVLTTLVVGFVAWALTPARPLPEALAALDSDASVEVRDGDNIEFLPLTASTPAPLGVVIYPGGRVDPRAYAPLARALATRGHVVVIARVPLNLAVFATDRAVDVIAAHPDVSRWVVGGHSLGGSMAARFVHENPTRVAGLFLWAAYPADNMTRTPVPVLSVHATRDGLTTPADIAASRANLPANATFVAIDGGNHAQFGSYGAQPGDNPATVSRAVQQARVVNATAAFLATC